MTQLKNFRSKRENVSLTYLVMVSNQREDFSMPFFKWERNLNVRMNSKQGRKKITYQRKLSSHLLHCPLHLQFKGIIPIWLALLSDFIFTLSVDSHLPQYTIFYLVRFLNSSGWFYIWKGSFVRLHEFKHWNLAMLNQHMYI